MDNIFIIYSLLILFLPLAAFVYNNFNSINVDEASALKE